MSKEKKKVEKTRQTASWSGDDHLGLTPAEQEAMDASVLLANAMGRVIGNGPQREHDLAEVVRSIHDIQARILSQVAARAGLCRPLGGRVNDG